MPNSQSNSVKSQIMTTLDRGSNNPMHRLDQMGIKKPPLGPVRGGENPEAFDKDQMVNDLMDRINKN